jgi:hypothetical protein
MSANLIAEVLNAPLPADWTIEGLAEKLLDSIANQASAESHSLALDDFSEPQVRRLIRPLLAHLAQKSENAPSIYGGILSFVRPQVRGEFVNRVGNVRLALRSRDDSSPVHGSSAVVTGHEQFAS